MKPAAAALASSCRVLSFSLLGEPGSGRPLRDDTAFDAHLEQLDEAMDRAGVRRAALCGVSYGGLVAVRYAAVRPERVSTLVLSSTPAPSWRPDQRVSRMAHAPVRSAPAFLLGAPGRLWREIHAALPLPSARFRAAARYLGLIARYPASPVRMARRVRILRGHDFMLDARAVRVRTLVLTGEPSLDKVVPVAGTREYLSVIPGAVGRTLECTGHIGLVTRPHAFAQLVTRFIDEERT
jgi:pimeloyl-ACP methyl ester carboxylesterase